MRLPIRLTKNHSQLIPSSAQPQELQPDTAHHTNGIPWLYGEVGIAVSQALTLRLRIHNSSGIPLIEGQSRLETGQRRCIFRELRPLGLEGYAHASEAERTQIGRRVWSRAAYGTLTFLEASS